MSDDDKNKGETEEGVTKDDRSKIVINKEKEMRTKDISKMISEGGLGADKYYNIKKK